MDMIEAAARMAANIVAAQAARAEALAMRRAIANALRTGEFAPIEAAVRGLLHD